MNGNKCVWKANRETPVEKPYFLIVNWIFGEGIDAQSCGLSFVKKQKTPLRPCAAIFDAKKR
jgi:hypothetical protein